MNRRQQDMIAYLVEENRVLKEQSKGRKLRLTDDQRRRLAARAKRLGRPGLMKAIAGLVVRMAQVARNLTDAVDGFLVGHRFLTCDRDAKFTARFRLMLEDAGVQLIRTPRQAPYCNAYAGGEVCCRERLGGLLKHYYRAV